MELFTYVETIKITKRLKKLTPTTSYEIIEINKPENYKFTNKNIYKIFTKKILDITGEVNLYHTFLINYKEKICYFYEFLCFGGNILSSFKPYKIILKNEKTTYNPLINIFIFNKIK